MYVCIHLHTSSHIHVFKINNTKNTTVGTTLILLNRSLTIHKITKFESDYKYLIQNLKEIAYLIGSAKIPF